MCQATIQASGASSLGGRVSERQPIQPIYRGARCGKVEYEDVVNLFILVNLVISVILVNWIDLFFSGIIPAGNLQNDHELCRLVLLLPLAYCTRFLLICCHFLS